MVSILFMTDFMAGAFSVFTSQLSKLGTCFSCLFKAEFAKKCVNLQNYFSQSVLCRWKSIVNKKKRICIVISSVARGGGTGVYTPPIGMSTKMQNEKNDAFLALLRLFYALEWTKYWFKTSFETLIQGWGLNCQKYNYQINENFEKWLKISNPFWSPV